MQEGFAPRNGIAKMLSIGSSPFSAKPQRLQGGARRPAFPLHRESAGSMTNDAEVRQKKPAEASDASMTSAETRKLDGLGSPDRADGFDRPLKAFPCRNLLTFLAEKTILVIADGVGRLARQQHAIISKQSR